MVDVAASGGYGISYKANRIVANPLTVTGSIGSISAKFNMQSLYEKLGISHDYVTKGPMALFNVDFRDFTAQEWERFQQNHWESFNIWLRDIADHRNMTPIEVEQLAFGRVWTGRQAVVNGLVDQLGGLDRAVAVAKELADIPSDEQVTLVHLPEKRDLLDMIFSSDDEQTGSLSYLMRQQLAKEFAVTQQLLTSARWRISDVVMIR